MCTAIDLALVLLLRTEGRDGAELGVDAADRQKIPLDAILWRSAIDLASAQRRPSGQRKAHPPPDAADADLPDAQHQQGSQGPQDLSLPTEGSARVSAEPSLGGEMLRSSALQVCRRTQPPTA